MAGRERKTILRITGAGAAGAEPGKKALAESGPPIHQWCRYLRPYPAAPSIETGGHHDD